MTDRTHPDSGRIITSGDVIAELQDRIAELEAELEAAPKAAPGKRLTREQIREVFMANGFTVKEGQTDLKQYVYDAAHALLELAAAPHPAPAPLSDAQIKELIEDGVFLGNCKEIVRAIEQAHGITGGQHGD